MPLFRDERGSMHNDFDPGQLIIPAVLLCAFAGAGVYAILRRTEKGWVMELLSGLLAAAVGAFWGLNAQTLYMSGIEIPLFGNGVYNPEGVGAVAGGVPGLLAGVWFIKDLRELLAGGFEGDGLIGRGIWTGLLLGVICSTLTHTILMTGYRNCDLRPLLIGAGFGAVSGLFAGVVISIIFWYAHKFGAIKIEERA